MTVSIATKAQCMREQKWARYFYNRSCVHLKKGLLNKAMEAQRHSAEHARRAMMRLSRLLEEGMK